MAELTAKKNTTLMGIIIILMVIAVISLLINEFKPKYPAEITELVSKLNTIAEKAVEEGKEYNVSFDQEDNSLIIKEAVTGDESAEKYKLKKDYLIKSLNTKTGKIEYTPSGWVGPEEEQETETDEKEPVKKICSGAELIIEYPAKQQYYYVEVSPSDGIAWIKGEDRYSSINRFGAWIGTLCVVAIFSYLHRENNFYRVFEHILIGTGMGMGVAYIIQQNLWELWLKPIIEGISNVFWQGSRSSDDISNICLIFAGLVGMLWYFQYSKKYLWISRIAIGISAGSAAGLGIKNGIMQNLPQIRMTFRSIYLTPSLAPHLTTAERLAASFQNLLMVVIVCCVLYYFFFSFRRETRVTRTPAKMGRLFLMISLGAFFGNTFLTRVIILVDRLQFLIKDWLMLGS